MEKRLESEMYRFKTKTREYSAFHKVKNNSSYGARQIFVSKCADIFDECKKKWKESSPSKLIDRLGHTVVPFFTDM